MRSLGPLGLAVALAGLVLLTVRLSDGQGGTLDGCQPSECSKQADCKKCPLCCEDCKGSDSCAIIDRTFVPCKGAKCFYTPCKHGITDVPAPGPATPCPNPPVAGTVCPPKACDCGWGGMVGTGFQLEKQDIGSNPVCDQVLRKCCDRWTEADPNANSTDPRAPAGSFCQKMLSPDGWATPFTGHDESNKVIPPWDTDTYCNRADPSGSGGTFRMQAAIDGVHHGDTGLKFGNKDQERRIVDGGLWADYTNKLRFTDETIAQEGLSFCIVGFHYRKSKFSKWKPMEGFLSIAQRSFDIGNHIHPNDARKMNAFKLPDPKKLRGINANPKSVWVSKGGQGQPALPTHYFKNVWLGVLPMFEVKGNNIDESADPVKLAEGFKTRPAHPDWQPDLRCKNPYKVSVTLIEADGHVMKNYLHIKVYGEPVSQPSGVNCPTGKIKLLMLEVRDQEGLPVGQFTDDVPCDGDELSQEAVLDCPRSAGECKKHVGTKHNQVPCMFSPPNANVHPNIFMFSASRTSSGGGGGDCRDHRQKTTGKPKPTDPGSNYVTEVHATWRFAQLDSGMVTELHFATMIIEDETPIQYYTSRLTHWDGVSQSYACVAEHAYGELECDEPVRCVYDATAPAGTPKCTATNPAPPKLPCSWCAFKKTRDCCWSYIWGKHNRPGRIQLGLISSCVNATYNTNRPYGYSAQYMMIRPTIQTRGGWDYFMKGYMTPEDVNCHVNINFGPGGYYELDDPSKPFKLGTLKLRETLKRWLDVKYKLNDTRDPSRFKPPTKEKLYDNTHHGHGSVEHGNRGVSKGEPWKLRVDSMANIYELPDWHNIGLTRHTDNKTYPSPDEQRRRTIYLATTPEDAVKKMFDSAHQDPVVLSTEFDEKPFREYFGSRYILTDAELRGKKPRSKALAYLQDTITNGGDMNSTMRRMGLHKRNRCPCPFAPTTVPPELQTEAEWEVKGRKLHFVNSMIAWVILVPIGLFVARYFKETYSRVFFLQEFWWYSIHVLCLVTALLFTLGGIFGMKVQRFGNNYEYHWDAPKYVHVITGSICLVVFAIHLLVGAFRLLDNRARIVQIALHWTFGWLEYLAAIACIMSSSVIKTGVFSNYCFVIYCGFLLFQLVFNVVMEIHLHRVDKILNLDPPRAYLPSPMMRVFHTDAPHAKFRVIMLAVFSGGCFLFYVALHIAMGLDRNSEFSIFQRHPEDADEPDYDNPLPTY